MAGYYAHTSQREFIGGPYPHMHFAGFRDSRARGKALSDIAYSRMKEYFSLYNAGSIIVRSDFAEQYFAG